MSKISVIEEYQINVQMFLIPKVKKTHVVNLEDSDEESSETYKKMTKLIETKEMDIPFNIIIAKIGGKLHMGTEFQNGKVIYRKIEVIKHKDVVIYKDSSNLVFIPADGCLTMCTMGRCYTCGGLFKKIYRCFDCFPKNGDDDDVKKQNKYDFCRACYRRRDHTNHRIIAITLNNDVVEKYPVLDS
jgi:hypothetical protein